jgi:hypothetical protein
MSVILIDRIGAVMFHNGVLRVDCVESGPNNQERPAGTLLIPANQAAVVLQSLIKATQELDRRVREQVKAAAANAASAVDGAGAGADQPPVPKPAARTSEKKASASK